MANPIVSGDWKYTVQELEGGATIATIVEYTGHDSVVSIPSALNNITVKKIGDGVFYGRTDIIEVIIPLSIEEFGDYVFAYSGITSLTIPDNDKIKELSGICLGCTSLATISIPGSVEKLTHSAFCGCTALEGDFTVPAGITDIGYKAFCGCTSLTSLRVSSNVSNIWESAFEGCTSIEQVIFPAGLKRIAYKAFYNCTSLTRIRGYLDNLKCIDASAFAYCSSLINMPSLNDPVRIGRHAFYECDSSLKITLTVSGASVSIAPNSAELFSEVSFEVDEETTGYVYNIAKQLDNDSRIYKIRLVKEGETYTLPSNTTVSVAFMNPFMNNPRTLYKYTKTGIVSTGAVFSDLYFNWTTNFRDSTDFIVSNVDISFTFGDVNLDGSINMLDYNMLSAYITHPENMPVKSRVASDLDHDGQVTQADLAELYKKVHP